MYRATSNVLRSEHEPRSAPANAAPEAENAAIDAVLHSFMDSLGADGAVMALNDPMAASPAIFFSDEVEADAADMSQTMMPRAILATANNFASEELRSEWRAGGGETWLHVAVAVPDPDSCRLSISGRFRSAAGDLRRRAEAALARIKPQLLAFLRIWNLHRSASMRLISYQGALNLSDIGIILVGREGGLLFANATAEALLASGETLRRNGRSVTARDLNDALKLQVAIEHVCLHAEPDGARENPVVMLRRRRPQRPLLVSISAPAGESSDGCDAGAVLRVFDPDRATTPLLDPVCAQYRLSPVESRLACLLAEGETIEGAAAAMRIKAQTARSYLKQIFLKTDTNRQSELVRLLLTSVVRTMSVSRFKLL